MRFLKNASYDKSPEIMAGILLIISQLINDQLVYIVFFPLINQGEVRILGVR